jgi:hypothetical protein
MQPRRKIRWVTAAILTSLGLALIGCGPSSSPEIAATEDSATPDRIGGHPNLNGVWQAMNTANWNLEGGAARAIPQAWELGALFAVPPGQSVVVGGTIPYRPEAEEQRASNQSDWPVADPETKCFRAGVPRTTYLPHPFRIVQGDGDLLISYSYATSHRVIHMGENHVDPDSVLVDQWNGWSNGHWDGDTLVVEVFGQISDTWFDRAGNFHGPGMTVTERYTLLDNTHMQYQATINDPTTFTQPWTISMPLYKRIEPDVELFEFKCIEFAEPLLYGELLKEPIQ